MKTLALAFLILVGCGDKPPASVPEALDLVDPFIGTGGHGHTFPGATMPFGMVQLSPDTRLDGWDGCSGYHNSDKQIYGFSHTHLQGTGVSDYGDVLLMPHTGRTTMNNGADGERGYRSSFAKSTETASPGYYSVFLDKTGVRVELTATTRVGVHRYRFREGESPWVVIDMRHRDPITESSIKDADPRTLVGHRISDAWARDQRVYFAARFSVPWITFVRSADDDPMRAYVMFPKGTREVVVSVGISAVDIDGAQRNLAAEAPTDDFDKAHTAARAAWRKQLGRIEIEGGTRAQQRTFYTALYHSCIAPNLFMGVDGRYRGTDGRIHTSDFDYYTVFSLWDTFRAAHPLFTILEPKRTNDFIRTMLAQYEQGGSLPVWELAGTYTGCMIGYHSVSVIADAYAKGIRDYDANLALGAMVHSASKDERGLPAYREFGFIPSEIEGESVSKTLEYAYDDWCIATLAKGLEYADIHAEYSERAQSYKNVFDPATGFMRAKRNNAWVGPFKPAEVNSHFTEANAWQYSLFVPHDTEGLIELVGGRAKLAAWLDRLFAAPKETSGREQADITGLIGQYAHGNEPSHHMAYLYCHAGQPWKTQERVREILDTLYTDKPDGLCGNEDCGQMSAWYVFSALGFYPVTPGTTDYVIGAPLFPRATIRLENGKSFTIEAPGVSSTNRYVQSVSWDGHPLARAVLPHVMIAVGGTFVFEMGPKPSTWGGEPGLLPRTSIDGDRIVPVPFVAKGERAFRGEQEIALGTVGRGDRIFWSRDGAKKFEAYTAPVMIDATTDVIAYAMRGGRKSQRIAARFLLVPHNWEIKLSSKYANQYAATGKGALIDGLRGGADWRTGDWQGYQGVDLDVTIDLGEEREIRAVRGSFLQDQRSWIWLPREMAVSVSTDGKTFAPYATATHEVDPKSPDSLRRTLAVVGRARARYVRVVAKKFGVCPDWHLGAGGNAWIFADEIEIE